ncbi:cytochrome P450 [Earliella scabrosa]|nr:cytochrome P450 [Earliella scabrosa]
MSKFWMGFLTISGHQYEYIKALHHKYGDILTADRAGFLKVLGRSGLRKGPHFLGSMLDANAINLVALQDIDYHLQRRRPWARAFTPNALKDFEERIASHAKQLILRLEEEKGVVKLNEWIEQFAYDFTSDMALGSSSELLTGKNQTNFLVSRHLGPKWGGRSSSTYCRDQTQKRIDRSPVQRKDLFYYLNHEDAPEIAPPSMEQLVQTVYRSDTVSGAKLASLFSCLMAHPETYKKLQAEIDKFYPSTEDIVNTAHHRDMHYLTAVINESLRLFPSVPGCTQREVPSTGITLPPAGDETLGPCVLHGDSYNFSLAPDTFFPERWLIASGDASAAKQLPSSLAHSSTFVHNEEAFIPFSYGPMNWVGKNLAQQEMRIVICAIMQRFHMRPVEGWTLEEYRRGSGTTLSQPVAMCRYISTCGFRQGAQEPDEGTSTNERLEQIFIVTCCRLSGVPTRT